MRVRIVTVDPVGAAAGRLASGGSRPSAASTGCSTTSRSRSGASPARSRCSRARRLHRHDLVDRPHRRATRSQTLDGRAVRVPDPGVRAVHVPDGHATRRWPRSPTTFPHFAAVLERAAARLLPRATGSASTPAASRPATRPPPRSRTRSRRVAPPHDRASWPAREHAPAAVLRPPRAARRAQHVRARRARALPGASRTGRSTAAGSCNGIGTVRAPARIALGGGGGARLLPALGPDEPTPSCCASTTSGWR